MAGDPAGSISASPAELPGGRVALRHQTPVWLHHIGTLFRPERSSVASALASVRSNVPCRASLNECRIAIGAMMGCKQGPHSMVVQLHPGLPFSPAVCSTRLIGANYLNRPYQEPTRVH